MKIKISFISTLFSFDLLFASCQKDGLYTPKEHLTRIENWEFYDGDSYWIAFSRTTVTGMLQQGMKIEGTWSADGSSRELSFDLTSPRNAEGTSDICSKVFSVLKNASSYSGDKNVLIIKRDNSSFIELRSENLQNKTK